MKKTKEVNYYFGCNDLSYVSIYGRTTLSLGGHAYNRTDARRLAKHKAESAGWSDYWVEEITVVRTTIKIP